MIGKHHNHDYSTGIPLAIGDRYYGQDLGRDFNFLRGESGQILSDLSYNFPVLISGGVITQGAGANLNITAGKGYALFEVDIPDTFAALPPSVTQAYLVVRVFWGALTNFNGSSSGCSAYTITNDGTTLNYVKVAYAEADGNTRTRKKKAGSYAYEKTPFYDFTVNSTPPTDYEVCLGTFTSSGGVYTILESPYVAHQLRVSTVDSIIRQHGFLPKSQVVIAGGVDTEGKANFLSASTDGVALAATATPVLIAYANGQDEYGQKNYIEKISADVAKGSTWGTLPAGTSYLYKELDITDPDNPVESYGSSLEPPDYVTADNQIGDYLLHFEDTGLVQDEYNHSGITKGSGASRATITGNFGSYCASFDGTTNGYIGTGITPGHYAKWTIETRWRVSSLAANRNVFGSSTAFGLNVFAGTNGKLNFYMSSNGSSWDLQGHELTTVLSVDTWYHIALSFDGSAYRIFINGSVEKTVTTSTPLYSIASTLNLGKDGSSTIFLNGYQEEFRFSPWARYTGTFTAPVAAFTTDASIYNITLRKFPYIGTNKLRVYLGEAVSNGSTVSSVITYALNGRYVSHKTLLSVSTTYNFAHNLGVNINYTELKAWIKDVANGNTLPYYVDSNVDYTIVNNNYLGTTEATKRLSVWMRIMNSMMNYADSAGDTKTITAANGAEILIKLERSF